MNQPIHTDHHFDIDHVFPDAGFEQDETAEILSVLCEVDYRSAADIAYLAEMIGSDR